MNTSKLTQRQLLIAVVFLVNVAMQGMAQLTLKVPKWEKFVKITTEGVNLRKAPNSSSPKLLSQYEYGDNTLGDAEAYYWGTSGGYTVHLNKGDIFPVLHETSEWYCLYFPDIWYERYIASKEVYIMKKFCTQVFPVDIDNEHMGFTGMEQVPSSDGLLIGTYYFGSASREPFVRFGHKVGKYIVAADYGDAGYDYALTCCEGETYLEMIFDINKVKNNDVLTFLHKNKVASSVYDVWVRFPDCCRQFVVDASLYPTESYTFAENLPVAPKPNTDNGPVYDFVDEPAKFPGDVYAFLSQNIKYPVECQRQGIQGRVLVQFVINTNGSITEVKTMRSPDSKLTEEAERVVKMMPRWNPARKGNKTVRMRCTLPIMFRL